MQTLMRAGLALAPWFFAAALPAQWGALPTPTAPAPRSGALLAYDFLGNRTLLYGGNFTTVLWSLTDTTWTQLTPTTLPATRAYANLATNPLSGEILLYGGYVSGSQYADDETWRWNGTDWQLLAPTATPGGLARHGMAFDLLRQRTVLFGGRYDSWQAQQVLADTWEFDGTTWTLTLPTGSPPGLIDMAMSYHPALDLVMLFGGRDASGTARDETYVYDGAAWSLINTTGPRPAPRIGARMVPILGRNLLVLAGGRDPVTMEIFNDTWEHDGTSWRQITNVYGGMYPARADFGLAHDFTRDRLVAFGGVQANGALRDDTWEYGAQFQTFGLACAGSAGTPTLTSGALPKLGATTTALVDHVPPAIPFAFMAVGLSRTQWALGSLPTLLTGFGMPGCRLYTSADLLVVIPATAGVATWSFPVPLQPSLVGEAFYLQGVTFDPAANPMGLATSNAATLVVGN